MDRYSINIKKRILRSYLKDSTSIVRIKKSEDNPNNFLSYLELHKMGKNVWFIGNEFYIIHKGIKIDLPEGYCVCFDNELNLLSRFVFFEKYHRPILVLVWFRDVMDYSLDEIRLVMDNVLQCEGFSKLARCILLLSMRLK